MKQHNNIEYSKGFTTTSSHSCGFTLIELLVVVAVLGILAGGILIALNIGGTIDKASLTKAKKFAASLENGLAISQVGKWSFEDADTSDTATDTSGYSNNGNLGGPDSCITAIGLGACPTKLTASACELGLGKCLSFDGTDDYVEIPNSPSTNFKTGDFTLSAWLKTNTTGASKGIIETATVGFGELKSLRINDSAVSGKLTFFVRGATGPDIQLDADVNINDNNWHHVVGVRNGTSFRLYKDGVLVKQGSGDAGDTDTGTSWRIARTFDVSSYTSTLIDQVQIYSEALTLSQIHQLHAEGLIRHALAFR